MNVTRPTLALAFLLAALPIAAQDPSASPQQRDQHAGRRMWGGGGMMGRGVMGSVTEITPDHFTVKTESGDLYTIHYSVNTRIMKGGGGFRASQANDAPFTPPVAIKPTDIKIGDAIAASGEMDPAAKSVGAVVIFQVDPEPARRMR